MKTIKENMHKSIPEKHCLGLSCPERFSLCCGACCTNGEKGHWVCKNCLQEFVGGVCTAGDDNDELWIEWVNYCKMFKLEGSVMVMCYEWWIKKIEEQKLKVSQEINRIIKKKEQVNGFQPYGIEGYQAEAQKKIYFDGFDDGRGMLIVDLISLKEKL